MMGELKATWANGNGHYFQFNLFSQLVWYFCRFFIDSASLASTNLQGRYLSPFLFFFVPFVQNLGKNSTYYV